jgi:phosphoribosylformylglycinamidine synthase
MPRVRVTVTLKPSLLDAQGRVVLDALHALGYDDVSDVRIGKVIELETKGSSSNVNKEVTEMCNRLLTNPVIENYTFEVAE